jgi:hypothetical protein
MRGQKSWDKVYHTTKPSEDASEELRILKDAMATRVGFFDCGRSESGLARSMERGRARCLAERFLKETHD